MGMGNKFIHPIIVISGTIALVVFFRKRLWAVYEMSTYTPV